VGRDVVAGAVEVDESREPVELSGFGEIVVGF